MYIPGVLLRAGHQTDCLVVRMILSACFDNLRKGFFVKKNQFR